MKIKLIDHTSKPIELCALAARVCYGVTSDTLENFNEWYISGKGYELIRKCIENGHESVLEHASFSFLIDKISRVCSHQIVRSRIASYSQRSQRYCNESNTKFVTPETINDENIINKIDNFYNQSLEFYKELKSLGVKGEDARFILPHSCETTLLMTMNVRELRHFLNIRLDKHAQWEIRAVAKEILKIMIKNACEIFFEDIIEKYKIEVE